jgi:hypothetical protein
VGDQASHPYKQQVNIVLCILIFKLLVRRGENWKNYLFTHTHTHTHAIPDSRELNNFKFWKAFKGMKVI